ncbi:hypothetical protein GLOIN_2v1790075 [Rhizophagus irregularis DAOM 181602=DAOM 197198]|nr:hypothetical protein GLOIN_2v1790075 [Rhizophagus irregularis DAOM 181602=DAOM 197198]
MGNVTYDESVTDDGLDESSEDEPDEDEDNINLADKQVKHQLIMANSSAKTLAKNPKKNKKLSEPEATQILTGYKAIGDEQEKQCEKFQAMVYDISEEMMMATLWQVRKPCEFLQTSKGRRKLVAYFENWKTTLRVLDKLPVTSPSASKNNNELKNPTIQKKVKKSPKNGGGGIVFIMETDIVIVTK